MAVASQAPDQFGIQQITSHLERGMNASKDVFESFHGQSAQGLHNLQHGFLEVFCGRRCR
jgi:hypothetical protein